MISDCVSGALYRSCHWYIIRNISPLIFLKYSASCSFCNRTVAAFNFTEKHWWLAGTCVLAKLSLWLGETCGRGRLTRSAAKFGHWLSHIFQSALVGKRTGKDIDFDDLRCPWFQIQFLKQLLDGKLNIWSRNLTEDVSAQCWQFRWWRGGECVLHYD